MAEKTQIDLSALYADSDVIDTKSIRGVMFEFKTKPTAKTIRDLDMNPDTNPNWEFDLQHKIVKSPVLSQDDWDAIDARASAEIIVECLNIGGLNARPTFR